MANTQLGTISGQIDLDVRNAMDAYTSLRQYHLSTFSAMGQAHGTLESLGSGMMNFGQTVVGSLVDAGIAWGEFERKVDYIGAVAGASQKEMDKLTQTIMRLGAETIYTNSEIADGFTELAKAGVSVEEIVGGIGEGITHLGAAADIGLAEASTIMMSVIATWGKAKEEAAGVADTLAGAANASMVEISDLGVSMKYAGGVAASMGVSFEDVATSLAIVGQRAIKGSTAGTNLRQILLGLTGTTKKATKEMEALGIITEDGTNRFFTAEGQVKSLADVTDVLAEATNGMSDAQRAASLRTMFGIRQFPTLVAWLDAGGKGFDKMAKEIEKTKAAEVAAARLDNLAGDIEFLTGEMDNLMLSIGYLVASTLRPLVQTLEQVAAWFNGLSGTTKTLVINIMSTVGVLSLLGGSMLRAAGMASFLILQIMQLRFALLQMGGVATLAGAILKRAFTPPVVILLIAAAIAALVGGLIYFFTKTEAGIAIWAQLTGAFEAFMAGPGARIIEVLTQIATIVGGALATGLNFLTEAFNAAGSGMAGAASGVGSLLGSGLEVVANLFSVVGQVLSSLIMPIVHQIAPIFAEFASAIAGVSTNMQGMAGASDLIAQVLVAVINMATQLILVFIQLGVDLAVAILGMLPTIIVAVVEMMVGILTAIVSMLPTIIQAFVTGFTSLVTAITTILPQIIQAVIQLGLQIITALIGMLPQLIQAALQLFMGLVQGLTQAIPLIINGIVTAIPMIMTALVAAIPLIIQAGIDMFLGLVQALIIIVPQVITALVEAIPQILQALIDAIPLILDAATQAFTAIVEAIPQIIPPLIEAVINLLPTIIETLISMIPALIDGALQLFLAIVQAIPQIVSQLIPAIINLLPTIISTVIGMIPQLLDAAIQLFMAIVQAVPQILDAVISALIDLGTQMINGLVQGLQNAGGAVMDAIGGIVDGAIGWAKDLLGIKSPSRVFRQIGEYVGQGMAIGIKGTEKQVTKAMDSMITKSTRSFKNLVEERNKAAKRLGDLQFRASERARKGQAADPALTRQINAQVAEINALNNAIRKESATISRLKKANTQLTKLARDRDMITERLKAAQKKLKKLEDGKDDHFSDYVSSLQGQTAVTDKKTVEGMMHSITQQTKKTTEFNKLIADLKKRGLDQQSLNELIEEFASSGSMSSAKAIAAASDKELKALAAARKKLGVEAEKTAMTTGKIMYDAGIDAAKGLVKGLEKELASVNAAAKKIAAALSTTIKKELGIKSPSRVMMEAGNDVMAGLIIGILDEEAKLKKSLVNMADDIKSFADDVATSKQFEVETLMNIRASDQASIATSNNTSMTAVLERLSTRLDNLENGPREINQFGDIMISLKDLEQIKNLEDFLEMIRVYKRQRGH